MILIRKTKTEEFNILSDNLMRSVVDSDLSWTGKGKIYRFKNNKWYKFNFVNCTYVLCEVPVYEKLYLRNKNLKSLLNI